MGSRAGFRTHLVDQRRGEILDQRRMRPHEGIPAGITSLDQALDVLAGQFLHLVVHAAGQPRRCDQGKGLEHIVLFETGETQRSRLESGKLETADAPFDQPRNRFKAVFFVDRADQCHVDVAVFFRQPDLRIKHFTTGHGLRIVIGHIDHHRDTTRCRGP